MDVDAPAPAVTGAIMHQGAAIKDITPDRGIFEPSVACIGGAPRTAGLIILSPELKPRASLSTTLESRLPQDQVELLGDDF